MSRYPIPERYEVIEDYVKYLAKSTQTCYRAILNTFFRFLKIKPDEYFSSGRDYEKDTQDFAFFIKGSPPKTQNVSFSTLRGFFEHHDIEIKPKMWKKIRRRNHVRGNRALTDDVIPTNKELRTIFNHCKGIKDRALFMLCATTSMRIDEILGLKFKYLDIDERHITVVDFNFEDGEFKTKTGVKRHTFFTDETKDALVDWIKNGRNKFLKRNYRKSKFVRDKLEKLGYEFQKDSSNVWLPYKDGKQIPIDEIIKLEDRVFPFNYSNANEMWTTILENAGPPYNEKDTNPRFKNPRYKYHIHCLRKFWYTKMESTNANKQHIDTIGGHESELNSTYAKFTSNVLKETYDKYSSCLSIFSEYDKVESEIKPKLEEQDTVIESLVRKNKEFEKLNIKLVANVDHLRLKVEEMIDNRERELEQAERLTKDAEEWAKKTPEEREKIIQEDKQTLERAKKKDNPEFETITNLSEVESKNKKK